MVATFPSALIWASTSCVCVCLTHSSSVSSEWNGESGFDDEQISKIYGPIGIKLGGKSAPEIALSIIAQLVSKVYTK